MTGQDNGHNFGCASLAHTPDAELYENCRGILTEMGFDFADAWYTFNQLNLQLLSVCAGLDLYQPRYS